MKQVITFLKLKPNVSSHIEIDVGGLYLHLIEANVNEFGALLYNLLNDDVLFDSWLLLFF